MADYQMICLGMMKLQLSGTLRQEPRSLCLKIDLPVFNISAYYVLVIGLPESSIPNGGSWA